jgi:hypothetical protein
MTNQELIQKATITTAAMASAGKLNAKQANRFVDYVEDESMMKDIVRIERFTNEEMFIEKLGVGRRVAVPKAEAADPQVRYGISTSKVTLAPVEIMVPFEIGDLVKKRNIEGKNLEDHIIKLMAKSLANNLEELHWLGNTNGPAVLQNEIIPGGSDTLYRKDTYLALYNGWLKAAEAGHIVNAQGADISLAIFGRMLRAMPRKFKRNKGLLKWLLSSNHEQHYREGLAGRQTPMGDAAVNSKDSPNPFGVSMLPVGLLPEDPLYSEDSVANADGTTPTALTYGPITDLVLTTQTLDKQPEAKYVVGAGNDYTQDLAAGTWTRLTGGNIGSGATIKATYNSAGKIILTNPKNMIIAIGLDNLRIERDRNIYKTVNEFAITADAFCTFEETDAVVLATNVAVPAA